MGALRAEDWTAIGALTAAGVVAISCLLVVARLSQRAHIRTRRSQREAGIWSSLAEVAQRINDGDPLARMGMTALIADRSTRRFAIEKLADMVRSMPETSLEGWCSRSTLRRIEGWVRKELKESDSGRRANCVEIVGTLKLVSCVGLLRRATHDASSTVRIAACRTLAGLDPRMAIGLLLGTTERDGVWAADLLRDIVADRGARGLWLGD